MSICDTDYSIAPRFYLYGCLVVWWFGRLVLSSWNGRGRAEDGRIFSIQLRCRADPPARLRNWAVKLIGGWMG